MCDGFNAFTPRLKITDSDITPQGILDGLKRCTIRMQPADQGAGVMCIADAVWVRVAASHPDWNR